MNGISDIVSDSLKLAYKHKILWVFALMVAAGGSNFKTNNISDVFPKDEIKQKTEIEYDSKQEYNNYPTSNFNTVTAAPQQKVRLADYTGALKTGVLGTATAREEVIEKLTADIKTKSVPYIIGTVTVVTISAIFFILLALFVQSWATGAFLKGIKYSIENHDCNLRKLSGDGRFTVKRFMKYKLAVFLVYIVLTLLLLGPFVLAITIENVFLMVLFGLVALPLLIVLGITIALSTNYAYRFISYKDQDPLTAFKSGFKMFRSSIGKTFILGIVNSVVSMIISIIAVVLVVIAGGLLAGTALLISNIVDKAIIELWLPLGVLSIPLIILFGLGAMAIQAYTVTYINFTWSKMFLNLTGGQNDNS